MKKKQWSTIIKLLVSALILLLLVSRTDFSYSEFSKIFLNLDLRYFLPSLFGVAIVLGLKSYRWKMLIKDEGFEYSAKKAFGAYMASDAIGIVTPGRIGEIARLYYLREESRITFYAAFKTIVSDRVYDFTILGWLGFSGFLFYMKWLGNIPGVFYVLIVLGIVVSGLFLLKYLLHLLSKNKSTGKLPLFSFLRDALSVVLVKKSVGKWLITLVAYIIYFLFSDLILLSLGVRHSFVDIAFILSLMSLATILPISVAGFGTREASLVILFAQYGINSATAISFSLLHFTAFFLMGGLIGLVFWLLMPISLKVVKEETKKIFYLFKVESN